MMRRAFSLLVGLMCVAGPARAGVISVGPSLDWMSRNYSVRLDRWSTAEANQSRATGTGTAGTSDCGYITTDQRLYVSGGAWGEASRPAGRASASASCELDFQFTVLEERGAPERPGSGFSTGYETWTYLDLDPSHDVARYGWSVGIVLDSLDRDFQRSFVAADDTPGCEPSYPGDVRSYPCVNSDMHSAILSGFQVGERVSGRMFVNAFVDLRTVPEPASLVLLVPAVLIGFVVPSGGRLSRRDRRS